MYRRAHLSGDALELVRRRVVVIAGVAWLPLLLLSVIGGHALGGTIRIPFLHDIEAHIRFLIALPILVVAELIVHTGIRPAVKSFVERRIIVPEDMPKFHAAIDSAMRVRNSVPVEVILLVLVYTLGFWIWRSQVALGGASWYAMPEGTQLHLTLAGYWYAFVSIPIFQFILLRWYLRFFIWFRFLWQVSIFLREVAHALIDGWELPITGREEDAADQFSTLLLINGMHDGEQMALNTARSFKLLADLEKGQNKVYLDAHSLDEYCFKLHRCHLK